MPCLVCASAGLVFVSALGRGGVTLQGVLQCCVPGLFVRLFRLSGFGVLSDCLFGRAVGSGGLPVLLGPAAVQLVRCVCSRWRAGMGLTCRGRLPGFVLRCVTLSDCCAQWAGAAP